MMIKEEAIIPNEFKARYSKILGQDNKRFLRYCSLPLRKSIRINTIKTEPEEVIERLKDRWELTRVPWYEYGYWVKSKSEGEEKIGNTLEHFMGYFYVQEASSMIPPVVLAPEKNDVVLDMAAAPGSKTTQLCQMMNNSGAIIANDISIDRIKALRFNIEKMGCTNISVIRHNGIELAKISKIKFTKILLDAPCTSEGTIRKDWKVLSRWSIGLIKEMSSIQKRLILSAFDLLENEGVLVYSTCTLSPEENEEVIDYLIKNRPEAKIEKIKVKGLKYREGIEEWEGKVYSKVVKKIARVWPQDNDSEGFVIAKIVKE